MSHDHCLLECWMDLRIGIFKMRLGKKMFVFVDEWSRSSFIISWYQVQKPVSTNMQSQKRRTLPQAHSRAEDIKGATWRFPKGQCAEVPDKGRSRDMDISIEVKVRGKRGEVGVQGVIRWGSNTCLVSPLAPKEVENRFSEYRWTHSCIPRAHVPVEVKLAYRTLQLIHCYWTYLGGLVFAGL